MGRLLDTLDPERIMGMLLDFVPGIVAALLVLAAFWIFLKVTRPTLRTVLKRADFDEGLIRWLVDNVYHIAITLVAVVMAVSQLGIDMGAALAGLGVAGVAVGFAAQDSIANTIAGFLIFWDKPFQVGDFLTTQDRYGKVARITMRTTRIRTNDNTYVILPNRQIIEDMLVNHSIYGEIRIRVPVGIAYKEDIPAAREAALEAAASVGEVLEDPAPDVVVTSLGDSSVNLDVRVWISSASRERAVFFRVLEACKLALDEAGIEIPFPHLQLFLDEVKEPVWKRAEAVAAAGVPPREMNGPDRD
ncbi:MAG: mechanosensitive ion channel family protein [bacterium]